MDLARGRIDASQRLRRLADLLRWHVSQCIHVTRAESRQKLLGGINYPPTPVAASASQVKTGGTLRVGIVGDITGLDPFVWSPNNSNTVGEVHDQLITYDTSFSPQPRLAESWDLSSDNKQIKFNLRQGVQYQNGREFTSDDVKYTLLKAQDPKTVNNATVGPGAKYWSGVETPDKYTVVLSSDVPRPGAFDSILYLRILDKETTEGPNAATTMNGDRTVQVVEWALRRPHHAGQERQLLGAGAAVSRPGLHQGLQRSAGDGGRPGVWRH